MTLDPDLVTTNGYSLGGVVEQILKVFRANQNVYIQVIGSDGNTQYIRSLTTDWTQL